MTNLDVIAWADEPATDQVRPKDLRDEFAMSIAHGVLLVPIDSPKEVAERIYAIADAMMKAREGKV